MEHSVKLSMFCWGECDLDFLYLLSKKLFHLRRGETIGHIKFTCISRPLTFPLLKMTGRMAILSVQLKLSSIKICLEKMSCLFCFAGKQCNLVGSNHQQLFRQSKVCWETETIWEVRSIRCLQSWSYFQTPWKSAKPMQLSKSNLLSRLCRICLKTIVR